jgi:hypothetical protein
MVFDSVKLLGENSYPAIVKDVYEKIQNTKCQTMLGNELCQKVYHRLNESITPMLELKEFTTAAEKIAGDDVSLKEIIDFVRKRAVTGDLNYIINLCKEEHFKNMGRLNHPKPEETLKAIEEKFGEPSSVIEQGIKSGIFDNLQSALFNKIKSDLSVEKPKKLNESQTLINGSLVKYSPVGIKFEDLKNNQIVYLMESEIIGFKRETKNFVALMESEISIPDEHKKLLRAINTCAYSPEIEVFSLNENWDFNLELHKTGLVTINGKEIPKDKVKDLLLESIQVYVADPLKVKNFNKINFLNDADNFVMLMENHQKLIKFDNLETIKNLNENSYIIFEKDVVESNEPKILASSDVKNKLFESYQDMLATSEKILGNSIVSLFEHNLINEQQLIAERNSKIVELNEQQKDLNFQITKVQNLKSFAEQDSPALIKLNEQENILSKALDENLKNLNFYKNEFKLY